MTRKIYKLHDVICKIYKVISNQYQSWYGKIHLCSFRNYRSKNKRIIVLTMISRLTMEYVLSMNERVTNEKRAIIVK